MVEHAVNERKRSKKGFFQIIKREWPLHLLVLPGVVAVLIFHYFPLAGQVMAFQNFNPMLSFFRSPFVGWANFKYILTLPNFWQLVTNTVIIAFWKIVFGILVPLVLALMINEVGNVRFKKIVQTSMFLPYFLSWVVLGAIFRELFSLDGIINYMLQKITGHKVFFMANGTYFRIILVVTDVWKGMGYNMIIFLAAITGVDSTLYEAAAIDGCGRMRQTIHVTLPGISSMVILVSTLALGSLMNAGFDQVFMMYNPLVYDKGDILDTFIYRLGLVNRQYSASAALGMIKSAVSLVLVSTAYYSAYKFSDYRIF